ncbi:Methyltransferase [Bradyrhizobium sp. STM 3843]|uniref:class I SAM-dependent methyltransferase n=1 Tax=Bradyrhizobium sp. STM 3843 TaxID=551947 RepID=UPI00024046D7|nr:class I SAM-dependent methyltransferase [Bradyrhizobium sp. STM 3843]CCE10454.1 Methyltransferase [Bradyrhizobium sp. STM 3843]
MADEQTLAAYDQAAAAFATDWHTQPAPEDLHDIITRFFTRGGRTADIGCGSGREVAWLEANGYPAQGFDASEGLLMEARARYPQLPFSRSELPALSGIADGSFDNVLCETVIMHLDRTLVPASVRRMLAIARPGGVLYLSWRVTTGDDVRDPQGRLYASVDTASVLAELSPAQLLLDEELVSVSSGKTVHRLVAKKAG